MAITKTQEASTTNPLLAITAIAANTQQLYAEQDVSSWDAMLFCIFHAPDSVTTPTKGTAYIIEGSIETSGNSSWTPVTSFVTGLTASTKFDLDGTEAVGQTVIEESATTGITVSEWVFFKDAVLANSEWRYVVALSANTSFTIGDALTNEHLNTTDVYTKAEVFRAAIDCGNWKRIRARCDNNYGAGTSIAINARVLAELVKYR